MVAKSPHQRASDLALLALAVVWGSSYLTAKSLLAVMGVLTLLSLRFLVTTLALALLWLRQRQPVTSRELRVALTTGVIMVVIFLLETYGVAHTSATNAGLIVSLAIVLTPLVESAAKRHWLPGPFFVATVVAIVGVGLLVSSHGFRSPSLGDVLMLAAAFARALHVTLMARLSAGHPYSTLFMTLVQCGLCATVFTLLGGSKDLSALRLLSASQWLALLYLGLVASVAGFLVLIWSIRITSASRSSLLLGTEPLWAVVVAILVGHETLPLVGVFGGVLIVGATYVAQGIEQRHRDHAQNAAAPLPPTVVG